MAVALRVFRDGCIDDMKAFGMEALEGAPVLCWSMESGSRERSKWVWRRETVDMCPAC